MDSQWILDRFLKPLWIREVERVGVGLMDRRRLVVEEDRLN